MSSERRGRDADGQGQADLLACGLLAVGLILLVGILQVGRLDWELDAAVFAVAFALACAGAAAIRSPASRRAPDAKFADVYRYVRATAVLMTVLAVVFVLGHLHWGDAALFSGLAVLGGILAIADR